MVLKSWRVANRLWLLIGSCLLAMLGLLLLNLVLFGRMEALAKTADERATDRAKINQASGLGANGYRIVADSYINRNFDEADKNWKAWETQAAANMAEVAKVVDTPSELAWAHESQQALEKMAVLYKTAYLPKLKSGADLAQIQDIDDHIDKLIDLYTEKMGKIDESIKAEAIEASEVFAYLQNQAKWINASSIVAAALLLLLLGTLVTRSITEQLGTELTHAIHNAQRIAHGDLTRDNTLEHVHPDSLAANLARMASTLADMVAEIRRSADTVALASTEIAQGNNDLSSRTEHLASGLEEATASMQELSGVVTQNAERANAADRLSRNTAEAATSGGQRVFDAVATMRGVQQSSQKIADIIGVIDGIAFQTNILALNAAVEAARAGEQGRGFAVVASEVRNLASRSAGAAKEIKQLIDDSVNQIARGASQVDAAGQVMKDVVEGINNVNTLVSGISTASSAQSDNVGQITEAITTIDQTTQQNAALVEQSAAAALALQNQADVLSRLVGRFRTDTHEPNHPALGLPSH